MAVNPNPAVATWLASRRAEARNPFDVLLFLMKVLSEERIPAEQVQVIAGSLELAQLATGESTQRLAAFLNNVSEAHGRAALFPATVIGLHATALRDFGRDALALQLHEAILVICKAFADPMALAGAYLDRAGTLHFLGRYEEALHGYADALAVCEKHGLEVNVAPVHNNRAATLQLLGRYEESLGAYDHALAGHEKHGLEVQVAETRWNRANSLKSLGRYEEALGEFDAALAVFEKHGLEVQAAETRENRANMFHRLGRNEEALRGFDAALIIYEKHGLEVQAAQCRNNRANTLKSLGRNEEALRGLDAALIIYEKHGLEIEVARCRNNRANMLHAAQQYDEAAAEYERSLPVFRDLGERGQATANLAKTLWEADRRADAVIRITEARRIYRYARRTAGIDENHLEYLKQSNRAVRLAVEFATELDRPELAFEAAQDGKAVVVGDLMRQLTHTKPADDPRLAALRGELISVLDRRAKDRAEYRALRGAARDRAERLIRACRQLAPPAVPVDADPATLRDLQTSDALPADWAIIDFWRLENEVVLGFVVTRRGLTCKRLAFPVENKKFSEPLDRLLRSTRNPEDRPDDEGLSALGDYLVKPLLDTLKREGIHGLYLIPHGYLHALPLHAARWHEDGRAVYLCDAFDVAYLPSAHLLLTLPPTDWTGGVLSLANPNQKQTATLPFADWEGRQLRAQFGTNGRFFLGADATPHPTADWSDVGLLHFSCHGTGDENFAPLARLSLRGDPLLALDVMHRRDKLKTGAHVILNGCETGVKDWRAADEGLGLMTAFLLRGAGTVLATQWCVNDASAAVFTLHYLDRLRSGMKPIDAIRKARRRVQSMPAAEVVAKSDEVVAAFAEDEFPIEAAKSHFQAGIASTWAENEAKARGHFEASCRLLKAGKMHDEAEKVGSLSKSPRAALGWLHATRMARFDHPIHWGAFHLIGRVT